MSIILRDKYCNMSFQYYDIQSIQYKLFAKVKLALFCLKKKILNID